MSSPVLPPQPRPHALADLDVTIAEAEAARDRCRLAITSSVAGSDTRRARAFLQLADERLAQLYRSREVLLAGEQHEDPDSEAQAL